jgi:prevent-host-death family protein
MTVNIAEAKAKLSSLLSFVDLGASEVIISKRDKPMAVIVSYTEFLKMKKSSQKVDITKLPSTLDKYEGILQDEVLDDYKASRESYLEEKYK